MAIPIGYTLHAYSALDSIESDIIELMASVGEVRASLAIAAGATPTTAKAVPDGTTLSASNQAWGIQPDADCVLRRASDGERLSASSLGVTDEQYYQAIRQSFLGSHHLIETTADSLDISGEYVYCGNTRVYAMCRVTLPFLRK